MPRNLDAPPASSEVASYHARAEFVAALLKPKSVKQRQRVHLTLLVPSIDLATYPITPLNSEPNSDGPNISLLKLLSSASSRRTYRHRLNFNLAAKSSDTRARGILTTGLLVKILCSKRADDSSGNASMERARAFLCDRYETSALIAANQLQTKKAWSNYRPVAHMAAAFLQFVQDRQITEFDSAAFSDLRRSIGTVLANTRIYREILMSPLRRGGRPFLSDSELLPVPIWPVNEPSTVSNDLPEWRLRSNRT